jgi:hypothetical protein
MEGAMPEHNPKGRPVLLTTAQRGVFFGYADDTSGRNVQLNRGRICIYWPNATHGFMGLAVTGPQAGARVGPAADIEVRDVTSVTECTAAAAAAWEAEPWS